MKMTRLLMLAFMGVAAAGGPPDHKSTYLYSLSGIMKLEGHMCVFKNAELRMTGQPLHQGDRGDFTVEAGFATTESGRRIHIDSGHLEAVSIASFDRQAISNALTRTGITLDEFLQRTGVIPPQNGVFEIISGGLVVNGIYYQVDFGVTVVISALEVPSTGPGGVHPNVEPAVDQTQTIFVTEAYQTTTAVEQVTLTQTSTRDVFVTITVHVYNSVDATATNFVKQTVNVPEDQVIRSPAAGNIVVNTITVPSQTVLFVRDTQTNFHVQTFAAEAVSTLQHVSTKFTFTTVTINIPVTSTLVQTIVQTSVATTYVTRTIGSTIYTTTTVIISQGPASTPVY